jgi:hypothetical protein
MPHLRHLPPMPSDEIDDSSVETEIKAGRPSVIERYFGFQTKKFILALVGVIIFAVYLGDLLFGNASLQVLLGLEKYETNLKSEIARLKQENAKMQKAYFELKELEPSGEEH